MGVGIGVFKGERGRKGGKEREEEEGQRGVEGKGLGEWGKVESGRAWQPALAVEQCRSKYHRAF